MLGKIMTNLSPCAVCRKQQAARYGCCEGCVAEMFHVICHDDLLSLGMYRGKLQTAIRALKYQQRLPLARLFALELAQACKQQGMSADVVCAVPLHWHRYMQRGYNQSLLIAKPLAKELEASVVKVLSRKQATQQQAKLPRAERFNNVADAFVCRNPALLEGKSLLLIDDVSTTGATLDACAKALAGTGVKKIYKAVVAIA